MQVNTGQIEKTTCMVPSLQQIYALTKQELLESSISEIMWGESCGDIALLSFRFKDIVSPPAGTYETTAEQKVKIPQDNQISRIQFKSRYLIADFFMYSLRLLD